MAMDVWQTFRENATRRPEANILYPIPSDSSADKDSSSKA
jgi:hypothetical protein